MAEVKQGYGFGTFKGVYVPSMLTILGIIMYLRFGWVLGNAGLAGTIAIVCISSAITFLTAFSISSLATNMKIEAGGTYYMISRSLGLNAGAAVGLPLFFAQALSISFYAAGFAESVSAIFPGLPFLWIGSATIIVLALFALYSADVALKVQLVIFGLIAASLISFFCGHPLTEALATEETLKLPQTRSFWAVFAVFFPAVTGMEAGISMSGDLKNPSRSIPIGTFAAVLTSWAIYLMIPFFLSFYVHDRRILLEEPMVMRSVARWGDLILLGVWGASLSSALGSFLAAPRTLQALARDRIVFSFLGRGYGPSRDPRIATAVSFAIALGGIFTGGLNSIATVLSMFFLTAYGLLNMSAFFEALIAPPSWRPKFRVHWFIHLLGTAACFFAMLMISWEATLAALLISGVIYLLIQKRRLTAYWGDIRGGIIMLAARVTLYWLSGHTPNSHSWKPNILVLSGSPTTRWYLIALADAISHGKGFLTVATILPEKLETNQRTRQVARSIQDYLKRRNVPAFVKVFTEDDVLTGARSLVKSYGFGPMYPNTILLGESEKVESMEGYVRLLMLIHRTGRNLMIVREHDMEAPPAGNVRIDVWWNRYSSNVGLMLAFAYLLKTSPEWKGSALNLRTIVDDIRDEEAEREKMKAFIRMSRLEAEAEVFVSAGGDRFELIRQASRDAGIVFLGIRQPEKEEEETAYARYYEDLIARTDGFPPLALILSAEEIDFNRLFDLGEV